MGIEVNWFSHAGDRTRDNRDYGGVGIRADEALCIVLDGSTSGPKSGELAGQIARELIDWYIDSNEKVTAETLTARLRQIHEHLCRQYPLDSASYMIVHIRSPNSVLALHAGDCLLGRYDGKSEIEWLTQPHTLANVASQMPIAAIADLPARHRLTRSFRAREFMLPDAIEMQVKEDSLLVMATDGFWAELSADNQVLLMEGHAMPVAPEGDDRSVLRMRIHDGAWDNDVPYPPKSPDNFYVKRSS